MPVSLERKKDAWVKNLRPTKIGKFDHKNISLVLGRICHNWTLTGDVCWNESEQYYFFYITQVRDTSGKSVANAESLIDYDSYIEIIRLLTLEFKIDFFAFLNSEGHKNVIPFTPAP